MSLFEVKLRANLDLPLSPSIDCEKVGKSLEPAEESLFLDFTDIFDFGTLLFTTDEEIEDRFLSLNFFEPPKHTFGFSLFLVVKPPFLSTEVPFL